MISIIFQSQMLGITLNYNIQYHPNQGMEVWSQKVSKALNELLSSIGEPDFTTLNSNSIIYHNSYAYVLIKTSKQENISLKLIAIDMTTLKSQTFNKQNLKIIDVSVNKDDKKENLRYKQHLNSRIDITTNPKKPSFWMLTITTSKSSPQSSSQTFVYLSEFPNIQGLPSEIAFHSVNTQYSQIEKVVFHPQSSDYLVILYKQPYIDFIDYITSMSYSQMQLNLEMLIQPKVPKFIDIQFGKNREDILNIYLLSQDGQIYRISNVFLSGIQLDEITSVEIKNSSRWGDFKRFTSERSHKIKFNVDYQSLVSSMEYSIIQVESDFNQNKLERYISFKYIKLQHPSFIRIKELQNKRQFFFDLLTVLQSKDENQNLSLNAYSLANFQLKSPFANAYLKRINCTNPTFLVSNTPNILTILFLNSIYQVQYSNARTFLESQNQSLLHKPLIQLRLFASSHNQQLETLQPQQCGMYGVLFIQNVILLMRSHHNEIIFQTFYIHSKVNENQIDAIKKQFQKFKKAAGLSQRQQVNSKQKIDRIQFNPSNVFYGDVNNILQNRTSFLNGLKQKIKEKQLNLYSIRKDYDAQSKEQQQINNQQKQLQQRFNALKEKTKKILYSEQNSKKTTLDPKLQLFQQKVDEMKSSFDVTRKITAGAISDLLTRVEGPLKKEEDALNLNWNKIKDLQKDVNTINQNQH